MTSGSESPGYLFPAPTLTDLGEFFRGLPEGLVTASSENRLKIANGYLTLIRTVRI